MKWKGIGTTVYMYKGIFFKCEKHFRSLGLYQTWNVEMLTGFVFMKFAGLSSGV